MGCSASSCAERRQIRSKDTSSGGKASSIWHSTSEELTTENKSELNGNFKMASRKLERRPTLVENDMVDKLYHHFLRLDKNGNGFIDRDELLSIPTVAANPLAIRLLEILDIDRGSTIDFNEFVEGLSIFSKKTSRSKKLKFAFNVYDLDKDGYISNGELFIALKIMTGDHLSDIQLQQIVDKTIRDADKDLDGRISFDEFQCMVLSRNATFLDMWSFENL